MSADGIASSVCMVRKAAKLRSTSSACRLNALHDIVEEVVADDALGVGVGGEADQRVARADVEVDVGQAVRCGCTARPARPA